MPAVLNKAKKCHQKLFKIIQYKQHLEVRDSMLPHHLHHPVHSPPERGTSSGVVEEYPGQVQCGDELVQIK